MSISKRLESVFEKREKKIQKLVNECCCLKIQIVFWDVSWILMANMVKFNNLCYHGFANERGLGRDIRLTAGCRFDEALRILLYFVQFISFLHTSFTQIWLMCILTFLQFKFFFSHSLCRVRFLTFLL